MKSINKIGIQTTALSLLLLLVLKLTASPKSPSDIDKPGFAVLELYTSEGCSSCPPAEALLEEIQNESTGKPVYVLAFHVDYWDRLGWKDQFSSHAFSQRQMDYSQKFAGNLYTPQLVVNGSEEGNGSDQSFVRNALSRALSQGAGVRLKVDVAPGAGWSGVHYTVQGDPVNGQLALAVVQKHAISKVTRGENEGRSLTHVQIVRDLVFIPITDNKTGTSRIRLPQDFNATDWEIITFLQDNKTRNITGAGHATIIL